MKHLYLQPAAELLEIMFKRKKKFGERVQRLEERVFKDTQKAQQLESLANQSLPKKSSSINSCAQVASYQETALQDEQSNPFNPIAVVVDTADSSDSSDTRTLTLNEKFIEDIDPDVDRLTRVLSHLGIGEHMIDKPVAVDGEDVVRMIQ
ncbi:hypothetical protein BKA67DRAFT_537205 [Truncatella angustata]|uniref:Uncharacterized protein n=1 Tax=Truncatella angustata TaxID=152316 RepID=A0A9P8ZWZ2_9PEZI|nr:uncharacterized protein BKA67DRAFT_537205 [Truncatella angustata]KAH6653551.1 hypothetical protein BKA67DRAFT_537205 [Truncatella angustata]